MIGILLRFFITRLYKVPLFVVCQSNDMKMSEITETILIVVSLFIWGFYLMSLCEPNDIMKFDEAVLAKTLKLIQRIPNLRTFHILKERK